MYYCSLLYIRQVFFLLNPVTSDQSTQHLPHRPCSSRPFCACCGILTGWTNTCYTGTCALQLAKCLKVNLAGSVQLSSMICSPKQTCLMDCFVPCFVPLNFCLATKHALEEVVGQKIQKNVTRLTGVHKVNAYFIAWLVTWYIPFFQQFLKLLPGQIHQPIHFVFGALEIFDAEGVHRHLWDVQVLAPA